MTSDLLSPLSEKPTQAYLSDRMQVADLLQWILGQTGAAAVRMTSFSISEEFLRRLFFIRQSGLITDIDIVLDLKATNKTLILWPFIEQTVRNCHLAPSHAKILLVNNDRWTVSMVTSQNLTRGNRFESAVISTDPELFATLSAQLDYLIKNQSVPFHEVFSRTVGKN